METYNISMESDNELIIKEFGNEIAIGYNYIEVRRPCGNKTEILRMETHANLEITFSHKVKDNPPTYR